MSLVDRYDICVLGRGAGGLAVATGAALLGARVCLVAEDRPEDDDGGDLARAALLAAAGTGSPDIDFAAVRHRVAAVLDAAAPAASPDRLRALGIALIGGRARFTGSDRIAVEGDGTARTITARRFVIARGGRVPIPAIPGLDQVPFLTRPTLAALDRRPDHLAIVGRGAEALELAQAYRRLGSAVTLFDAGGLLPDEDPELVDLLTLRLEAEGLRRHGRILSVSGEAGTLRLATGSEAAPETIAASHLLIATGRRPDVDGLGLDAAGIAAGPAGIAVDGRLRTSNRRVHALGDAIGSSHQSHGAEAGIVLRSILFRQRARRDESQVPRVVRTDPGLARVGLTECQARAAQGAVTILRAPFHDNDRARAEGTPHGLVKIVTSRRGRILGAGIVGPHADELIQTWQLAIAQGLKIGAVAGLITPYPTLGEASKRAAGSFFAPKLLGAGTRRLVRWIAIFG